MTSLPNNQIEEIPTGLRLLSDNDELLLRNEKKESIEARIKDIELGIANRRMTAFCVIKYQWHEELGFSSKSDLIENQLPMSRQEVYKEKSRAEYELILFNGDISKVGTVRASHLDHLRSIVKKYYERYEDQKFFLRGVWALIDSEFNHRKYAGERNYDWLSTNLILQYVRLFLSKEENLRSKVQPPLPVNQELPKKQPKFSELPCSTDKDNGNTLSIGNQENNSGRIPQSDIKNNSNATKATPKEEMQNIPLSQLPDIMSMETSKELGQHELKTVITWINNWLTAGHKARTCSSMLLELFREDDLYIDVLLKQYSKSVSLENYVKTLKKSIHNALGTNGQNKAA